MKKKSNRKTNKLKLYTYIVSIILVVLTALDLILVTKFDILPFKYWIILFVVALLVTGLITVFMIRKKTKPIIKKILSGFAIVISILLIVGFFYINKTFSFLGTIEDTGYMIENYSVMVLNDSNYQNIEDIKDKNIGYVNTESQHITEAFTELDKAVTLNKQENKDYDELTKNLYNNQLDAIILEDAHKDMIADDNPDFATKTRTIYKIEIKVKVEDITKDVNVNKESFNIYITGIDTFGKISSVSRSDVNIIATVNPQTHQIVLTSIPRDYYVQLDGTTGYKDKLTHAGIYGVDKSVKTLENLLDIEINYYVKVNFTSVINLVDALDGIDVYSKYTFIGEGGSSFKTGYNRVNGKRALEFARTRKTVTGGDRTRGINQQALIQAMIKKACSKEIITKYSSILNSLNGSFQTNMSVDKMTDIIKKQLDSMAEWNITSVNLDGSNASEYTNSYPHQKLYVMVPDEATVENAKQTIEKAINGEILEGSYNEVKTSVNAVAPDSPSETPATTQTPTVAPASTQTKKQDPVPKEDPKKPSSSANLTEDTGTDEKKTLGNEPVVPDIDNNSTN